MIYKEYVHGPQAGFKGYIVNPMGEAVAYVREDGRVKWEW